MSGDATWIGPRSFTEAELVNWGKRIGESVQPPLWIALNGPLGAGKSVLARAICRGAGVTGQIPSPTFTLVQPYLSPRRFEIYHVDLFRLNADEAMDPLGWEELITTRALVLLEWAERAGEQQPAHRWEVSMDYGSAADERIVKVGRRGAAPELVKW